MNSNNEPFNLAYQLISKLNFEECNNCSDCCATPWIFKEELNCLPDKELKALYDVEETFFIKSNPKCTFEKECRCGIYFQRPLDCRLYPLDLLELEGELWWCVFTSCKKYKSILKKIRTIIPELEQIFTREMLYQYSSQSKITNLIYEPQRKKQYKKIQKFASGKMI